MHNIAAPSRWQTVMFDPLAYIHPERLHLQAGFETPAQRAAINRLLIAHYRLDMPATPYQQQHQPMRPDGAEAEAAKLLLKHWPNLPQILFLLGCRRLRLALARRGASLQLPVAARTFMALPLLDAGAVGAGNCNDAPEAMAPDPALLDSAGAPNHAVLLRQGVRQLQLALGKLPALLAQRLPLLFAPAFDQVAPAKEHPEAAATADCMRDPAPALTLMMAIQHVKRTPFSID